MATEKVCILCGEEGKEHLIILSAKGKKTVVQASVFRSDEKEEEFRRNNPTHVHSTCRNSYTKPQLIKKVAAEAKERERVSICDLFGETKRWIYF